MDAGYFRARISTLSDFDKIIGGMAWAMQVLSYGINIDVFYTDSLDLGQKIALTERLVMVLLAINCPHQIEPHQIVGLDYTNLLPVVKWLIKRSEEFRREHEAFNRLLALRHFHRITTTYSDRSEWCHVIPISHLQQLAAGTTSSTSTTSESSTPTPTPRLRTSIVNISPNKSATSRLITRLNEEFKDNQQVSFVNLPLLIRSANRNQSANYSVSYDDKAFNERVGAEVEAEEGEDDDDEVMDGCPKLEVVNQVDTDKVAGTSSSHDEHLLTRGSQNASSTTMNTKELNSSSSFIADHNKHERNKQDVALHKELDIELLATNQKILNLMRKLDSMPSRLEIDQYQRRFIELHQQLISKNRDVKKLHELYNSLDSTKFYLMKEINLLDSISSNLDLTNNSITNRDEFIKQFQEIVLKIQTVRDDVVARLELIRKKCDTLNAEYAAMLD